MKYPMIAIPAIAAENSIPMPETAQRCPAAFGWPGLCSLTGMSTAYNGIRVSIVPVGGPWPFIGWALACWLVWEIVDQ